MPEEHKESLSIETTECYDDSDIELIKRRFILDSAVYLNTKIRDKVSGVIIILLNRGQNFSQKALSFGKMKDNIPMLDWLKNIGIIDIKCFQR